VFWSKKATIIEQLTDKSDPVDELGVWEFFTEVSTGFPLEQMIHVIGDSLKNRKTRHSMCVSIANALEFQPRNKKYIEDLVKLKRIDKRVLWEIDEVIAERSAIRNTLSEIYGED